MYMYVHILADKLYSLAEQASNETLGIINTASLPESSRIAAKIAAL